MTDEQDVDVVVVGAGPIGLLVASELALGGVSAQVIDRATVRGISSRGPR